MSDQTTITLTDAIDKQATLRVSLDEGTARVAIEGEEEYACCRVELGDLADALTLLANHDERAAERVRAEKAAEPARRQARQTALDRQTIQAARLKMAILIEALEKIEAGEDADEEDDGEEDDGEQERTELGDAEGGAQGDEHVDAPLGDRAEGDDGPADAADSEEGEEAGVPVSHASDAA